ncbi:MAG: ribonuclease III [Pseudomonadota bacterium]
MTPTSPEEMQRTLQFEFLNQDLLLRALTHSSFVHENPHLGPDNESLEFLGDAVLGLAVGHLLIELYPAHGPGQLSKMRAAVVNERALEGLAIQLDLGSLLRLGRGEETGGGRKKASLLAGTYEALLGAIYLDAGFEAALAMVKRQFTPLPQSPTDHKTAFQELCQACCRMSPHYVAEGETGPPHRKTFRVAVRVGDRVLATGEGRSKKEAETQAAKDAFAILSEERAAAAEKTP